MDQPTLFTPRLTLRPFHHTDAPAVQRLAGAAEVANMTLNIPHPCADGIAEAWIATHQENWLAGSAVTFAITTAADGLCGTVSLHITRAHDRGELRYWIGLPYRGRGFATEAVTATLALAFDTLALHRVQASHLPRNPASGRVMQKVSMQREGLHRGKFKKGTAFEDVVEYAILRSDWDALVPKRWTAALT
jgi:RimJ/RimL family protein N-acetyltransferase